LAGHRNADFQICRIADFQVGQPFNSARAADWDVGRTLKNARLGGLGNPRHGRRDACATTGLDAAFLLESLAALI